MEAPQKNPLKDGYPRYPPVLPSVSPRIYVKDGTEYVELQTLASIIRIPPEMEPNVGMAISCGSTEEEHIKYGASISRENVLKSRAIVESYTELWKK